MATTYLRNDPRRRIEVQASGAFDADEIIRVFERKRREGTWQYALLFDSRLTTGEARFEDLERIRAAETELASNDEPVGPLAIVVRDTGLYRKACAYVMSSVKVRPAEVFEDRADAERWLDQQGF